MEVSVQSVLQPLTQIACCVLAAVVMPLVWQVWKLSMSVAGLEARQAATEKDAEAFGKEIREIRDILADLSKNVAVIATEVKGHHD